jgi:ornithine carbamoyltransferase
MTRHFLEVDDLSPAELTEVLRLSRVEAPEKVLQGKGVVLLFEKPSLRTRNSTEMAVVQLGGHPVTLRAEEVDVDEREPATDVARVLSRYHAAIGARVFDHNKLERMAQVSAVPVINLLSDKAHPCQALADLLTLERRLGPLTGRSIAYIGDGNNVCRSLMLAAAMIGMTVRVGCPAGYEPDPDAVQTSGAFVTNYPAQAVKGVDAVYTDVWASMGQEDEAEARRQAFAGFCVDETLMSEAAPGALFMHCLPAHRGEEAAAGVVDGPQSVVWEQAEDRMHAVRGLLLFLLGAG